MSIFSKIFGTHSQHEVKRIIPIVDKIEALAPEFEKLTDDELKAKTPEFKARLEKGETLDDLLPEAYATVREAATRVLGMRHYRVQLIGGVILHQGRITEMRTGEGKTLVSTLPAYLNALEGKGVHIVTVNDYLAKRDAEWMGQVHEFLGLTVGVILNSMDNDERREAYNCDITYATNNELGFDYLRDNMVVYKEELVQRELHYAIIDEVDSVLIDEARTPLIISGQSGKSTKLYEACDIFVKQLTKGTAKELSKMDIIMNEEEQETGDYVVDEKDKNVNLTEEGVRKAERFFQVKNLADPDNLELQHNINLALRAHSLMFKDKDFTENIIYEKLLNDKLSTNLGYLYENVVAQILAANGNELFYYTFANPISKHNYEIDFLLARKNKLCPIEIKSSGYKTHKSLDAFSQKYSDRILWKYLVYTKDLCKDQDIICLPVYMAQFL